MSTAKPRAAATGSWYLTVLAASGPTAVDVSAGVSDADAVVDVNVVDEVLTELVVEVVPVSLSSFPETRKATVTATSAPTASPAATIQARRRGAGAGEPVSTVCVRTMATHLLGDRRVSAGLLRFMVGAPRVRA
jgi:hypothetical protein